MNLSTRTGDTMKPAVLLSILLISGCASAVSVADYREEAEEVGQRNQLRYDRAIETLRARGYTQASVVRRSARPDKEEVARCYALTTESSPASMSYAVLAVNIDGVHHREIVLSAPVASVCDFFMRGSKGPDGPKQLTGTTSDGEVVSLVRIAERQGFARGRGGNLVYLDAEVKVLESRTILVEDTCNKMPQVIVRRDEVDVLVGEPPRERITWVIEREELDKECTLVVY